MDADHHPKVLHTSIASGQAPCSSLEFASVLIGSSLGVLESGSSDASSTSKWRGSPAQSLSGCDWSSLVQTVHANEGARLEEL